MATYDMVIRNAEIHDGLGGDAVRGDVAIVGGRIAAVGEVGGTGAEEIDAAGRIVTPGFVDIHSHYDGQCTWENRLAPSSNHGVTSVVMGNCGVGFAPCRPNQRDLLVKLMEGVEDIPEIVMTEGLPWNWESFGDYLDVLGTRELDIDVAAQLPHSALRVYVMGDRAVEHAPATADDLATMRALVTDAVLRGAIGVSTSRLHMHRTKAGELAPSLHSNEEELLTLAAGLREAGTGVFQLIPAMDCDPQEELALIRRIAEEAQRPLSFSLAHRSDHPSSWRDALDAMAQAEADGLTIRAQIAPRPIGILFGLDLSFHPFALHPSFRPLAALPLAEKVAAMRDPAMRAKLLSEQPEDPNPVSIQFVKMFAQAYRLGDPPVYEPPLADRIDNRAAALGITPEEYAYDLLLEQEGKAILYAPTGGYRDGNLDTTHLMLKDSHTIVGLADGGAHYGMICDASFPTFFLLRWSRDASPEQKFALPRAIAELTSRPADTVGLFDRGRIVPGCKADLNIIDLAALRLHAPTVVRDLPAGGKRLRQEADGYVATIVAGKVTYRDGRPTGVLPGRLVRGEQRPEPLRAA